MIPYETMSAHTTVFVEDGAKVRKYVVRDISDGRVVLNIEIGPGFNLSIFARPEDMAAIIEQLKAGPTSEEG